MPTALEIALAELGTKEIRGAEDNPRIVEYHDYTNLDANDDETAWCSAFVNWCVAKSLGVKDGRTWLNMRERGTGKANARSWLDYGDVCLPERGVVAILWRESPSSWKGHVGLVVEPWDGSDPGNVILIGGNQSNAVTIKPYPRSRVLGYRRA